MSDISQGEGWWQASDLKWYPPDQHPDVVAPAAEPVAEPEPVAPAREPFAFPSSPPPVPPMGVPSTGGNNTKWIVAGVLGVAVLVLSSAKGYS